MKLCFPVENDDGMDSVVYGHFGSAPMFILYNSKTNELDIINNQNKHHAHGMCSPLEALNGKVVDAIVVGGIGAGAINKLSTMGIKIFRASENTIQNNIDLFKKSLLRELTYNDACVHPRSGNGCKN